MIISENSDVLVKLYIKDNLLKYEYIRLYSDIKRPEKGEKKENEKNSKR